MTLESPTDSELSVKWKDPGNKWRDGGKSLSLSQVELQDSGTWTCTVSKSKKTLVFNIKILVLGKSCSSPLQTPPASKTDRPSLCSHCSAPGSMLEDRGRPGPGSLKATVYPEGYTGPSLPQGGGHGGRKGHRCKEVRVPTDPWRRLRRRSVKDIYVLCCLSSLLPPSWQIHLLGDTS